MVGLRCPIVGAADSLTGRRPWSPHFPIPLGTIRSRKSKIADRGTLVFPCPEDGDALCQIAAHPDDGLGVELVRARFRDLHDTSDFPEREPVVIIEPDHSLFAGRKPLDRLG